MSSIYNDALFAVIGLAQATNPYATITIGALPPDDGISIAFASGTPTTTFLTKGVLLDFSVVLNGKHTNAQIVSDTLNVIHDTLTSYKSYPSGDNWEIANIETISAPSYIGREQNNQILYGSSLKIKVYKEDVVNGIL